MWEWPIITCLISGPSQSSPERFKVYGGLFFESQKFLFEVSHEDHIPVRIFPVCFYWKSRFAAASFCQIHRKGLILSTLFLIHIFLGIFRERPYPQEDEFLGVDIKRSFNGT